MSRADPAPDFDRAPMAAGLPGGPRRALALAPTMSDAPKDAPARPMRRTDGRSTLIDPAAVGRAPPLGFGRDVTEAFARLL
ncbi:MAG: hypothetical protein AAF763_00575 [Pseudomonadota bacterium]